MAIYDSCGKRYNSSVYSWLPSRVTPCSPDELSSSAAVDSAASASLSPVSSCVVLPTSAQSSESHCPVLSAPLDLSDVATVSARDVCNMTDAFVFDCDGVLWHGDKPIPGVQRALHLLQSEGKQLYFVTNNSSKSRRGYMDKFKNLGFGDIVRDPSQIICTAHAVAAYLKEKRFTKKVYVIGEVGIEEELEEAGITWLGGTQDAHKSVGPHGVEVDSEVGCVVVGLDRQFNYYKLQYAQLCINELKAEFIATNTDQLGHFTPNQACAGSGGMVGAVEGCTGQNPKVIGKPTSVMIDILRKRIGWKQSLSETTANNKMANSRDEKDDATAEKCCSMNDCCSILDNTMSSRMVMVGDRLDTDILFGKNAGIGTMLVFTGIANYQQLERNVRDAMVCEKKENSITLPDFFLDSVSDLFSML
eukprot:GHVQ01022849.1.p1 GENE.GHVQ01022849.1~~GHVQ01022849.1.p1  ORF type:complete len:418 (-),score=57.81 GHVQ01022849.1:328-1581(-)